MFEPSFYRPSLPTDFISETFGIRQFALLSNPTGSIWIGNHPTLNALTPLPWGQGVERLGGVLNTAEIKHPTP